MNDTQRARPLEDRTWFVNTLDLYRQTVSSCKYEGYFLLGFQKILECKFITRPEMEAGSELVDCVSCFPALEVLRPRRQTEVGGGVAGGGMQGVSIF